MVARSAAGRRGGCGYGRRGYCRSPTLRRFGLRSVPLHMTDSLRLARRLADQLGCSRREAELYIEGGWVRVDGVLADLPQLRVGAGQRVELDPKAKAEPVEPVTIVLHKPAGWETPQVSEVPEVQPGPRSAATLLEASHRAADDRSGIRMVRRHVQAQPCATPLETAASGLVVFTQQWPIRRKLVEEAAFVEHELVVEVEGAVSAEVLAALNRAPVIDGRAMLPAKVSITSNSDAKTALRFAMKGHYHGQIAQMCTGQRLKILGIKRIRIGRIPLAGLASGQWRFLMPYERF